ncbi:MAG: phosphoribosylglycinamide formyltransferase [Proteobacteria bacterium]|nr:phosphoribosylglycinamide formyltransferase [Pseudomonadota bacterium]MBU2227440.1 phosphoribosylglycinamide formyltransferase [Pseudomonadota bacterium]MBU2261841.1 phosphoribosylglycinamide formyltransferase [Pseudomonadota bacterium]
MLRKIGIGVLVSGSGSNLQSIIDHIEGGKLDAEIRIVLSNNPEAYALERCTKHRIPTAVVDHCRFASREEFDRRVIEVLAASGVELVVMAGFMRVLSSEFFRAFPMKIMNIHPALLPSFPGIHVQQKAVEYGVKFSGCTVHFADEGVDTGPIIIQAVIPVDPDDTADTLAARILKEEHRIYPQAIQYYAEGRIEIEGRKVRVRDGRRMMESALHNPPLTRF